MGPQLRSLHEGDDIIKYLHCRTDMGLAENNNGPCNGV